MDTRRIMAAVLVVLTVIFLNACGTLIPTPDANSDPYIESPTPTPIPVPESTPRVLADCFLSFQVTAWQDLDGDGLWEATEPPLEGVEFSLKGTFAQIWGSPYLSGVDGQLTITTWSPGECIEQDYMITAVPPASYELTTPASITFPFGEFPYEAQFGFRAISE